MKFKVPQRIGRFGKANFRNENHGKEKVPAGDMIVTYNGGKRDFDTLFPMAEGKLSDIVWTEKGELNAPYMSLQNARKPENVTFTVFDQATARAKPIVLDSCKVKITEVTLARKFNITVKATIQFHDDPEEYSARLRRLMDMEREFSLEASQEDFWDKDPEEKDGKDKQKELDVGQDEEGEDEDGEGDEEGDEDEDEDEE